MISNYFKRKLRHFGNYCERESCGKMILARTPGAAKLRKYCSIACMRKNQVPKIIDPIIESAWGNWFAGFVDGEGCFQLVPRYKKGKLESLHVTFTLGLRRDDRAILEEIKQKLGFGYIYKDDRNPDYSKNTHPRDIYCCSNINEALALVKILKQFPLRAKKRRDFDIWATGVQLMEEGRRESALYFAKKLREVREYKV